MGRARGISHASLRSLTRKSATPAGQPLETKFGEVSDNRYAIDEHVTAADLDATIARLSDMTAPYFRADSPLMRRHRSMAARKPD